MIDLKKMDDKDFVFINKPLTKQEDKEFSDFLKTKKEKEKSKSTIKSSPRKNKQLV